MRTSAEDRPCGVDEKSFRLMGEEVAGHRPPGARAWPGKEPRMAEQSHLEDEDGTESEPVSSRSAGSTRAR